MRVAILPLGCYIDHSYFYYPNNFNINARKMYYCKGIDKKVALLHEYFQSAILHAPHFRWIVNPPLHESSFT